MNKTGTMPRRETVYEFIQKIGKNLHKLRTARKESIKTVSSAIKITPYLLNKIENGTYPNCKLEILFALCDYYEIRPTSLLD